MELTLQQLRQILPKNPYVNHWYEVLSQLLPDYDINTEDRIAYFLAQCVHESGGFMFLQENLNYKAESLVRVWPHYFPDMEIAREYEKKPQKIANRAYANRMGNGDEESGDGWKYCGRGLIQITGKTNYEWFAASINVSPEEASEYLQTFEGAAQSACWFWEQNKLNAYADEGDIVTMTKRINGGTLGLDDRRNHYESIKRILGA